MQVLPAKSHSFSFPSSPSSWHFPSWSVSRSFASLSISYGQRPELLKMIAPTKECPPAAAEGAGVTEKDCTLMHHNQSKLTGLCWQEFCAYKELEIQNHNNEYIKKEIKLGTLSSFHCKSSRSDEKHKYNKNNHLQVTVKWCDKCREWHHSTVSQRTHDVPH